MKKCKFPGCYTIPIHCNKTGFCYLHNRVLEQNNIVYIFYKNRKKKFYKEMGGVGYPNRFRLLRDEIVYKLKEVL